MIAYRGELILFLSSCGAQPVPGPPRPRLALELLRDLLVRLPAEEPDLVPSKRRIVPDLHPEPVLLLEPPEPVRVLLHQVDGDVRVDAEEELLLLRPLS